MTRRFVVAALLSALATAGCSRLFPFGSSSTSPTPVTLQTLDGNWASVAATTSLTTCTSFRWTISSVVDTTGSGTFTATCLGNMPVSGTATGTVSGTTMTWSATGTGVTVDQPSCALALSGSAVLEPNQIRVPFSGSTCLGPISGTEILRK